ncbi:MAG: glycine zipper 2TM domain-containing protein [Alphaproteobacteria bacterium]|nr:glycine zipper 2TM domain-containing protein [Alphaproteobacteria bacterium]
MSKKLLSAVCGAILLTGCADNINSDHYTTGSVGKVSTVAQCTVLSVRPISVDSGDTSAGTMLGGIAGGVAGSTIGHGRSANTLGAIGGALLGGLVGSATQKGLSSQSGYEYIVKLDNGQAISIAQGASQPLMVGQRCLVLYGNPSRIIAQ